MSHGVGKSEPTFPKKFQSKTSATSKNFRAHDSASNGVSPVNLACLMCPILQSWPHQSFMTQQKKREKKEKKKGEKKGEKKEEKKSSKLELEVLENVRKTSENQPSPSSQCRKTKENQPRIRCCSSRTVQKTRENQTHDSGICPAQNRTSGFPWFSGRAKSQRKSRKTTRLWFS